MKKRNLSLTLSLMLFILLCVSPLAIAEEKVTLTFLAPQKVNIIDLNTNDYTLWLEEQAGVDIVFQTIPEASVGEQISLILASGDLPDAFWGCGNGLSPSVLIQYGVDDDVFIPLDDLIEDCPNIKAALDETNSWGTIRQTDGHIYHIPQINVCQHCRVAGKMWYNVEWADTLGIAMPTTTEEFHQMLLAFKEKDPNGNGIADEIPLAGAVGDGCWHNDVATFLMNAFTWFSYDDFGFRITDGKADNSVLDDQFREGIKYLRMLYDEGLLYEGSFSQDNSSLKKLTEAEGGSVVGVAAGGFVGQLANLGSENAQKYRPVYPLTGPSGYAGTASWPYFADKNGVFVITSACENPEAAMRVVDAAYTGEGRQRNHDGVPGEYWRYAEEGEIGFNGLPAIWTSIKPYNASIPQNSGFDQCGPLYCSAEWRAGQTTDTSVDMWSADGNEYMLYVVSEEGYAPYADDSRAWPPLTLTVEENERKALLRTEWDKFFKQSLYEFVCGVKDVNSDTDWTEFLNETEACGMSELLEIYSTAYARQYL